MKTYIITDANNVHNVTITAKMPSFTSRDNQIARLHRLSVSKKKYEDKYAGFGYEDSYYIVNLTGDRDDIFSFLDEYTIKLLRHPDDDFVKSRIVRETK